MKPPPRAETARRMQMRYGFNEIDAWRCFSLGKHREEIRRRLRLMGTEVVRIFVFDKPVPDPVSQWSLFAAYVQGVLDIGARPMITFAKFAPPFDEPRNIRTFVARCVEIVWSCIEEWGGAAVCQWYWCVWNEPNNWLIGGGLTFEQYRRIYQELAAAILRLLEPYLKGRKARIGGPAVDSTHQPFWMDWIVRFVEEIADPLVGFVSWHRYGDWRPAVPGAAAGVEMYGFADSPEGPSYEALLMAQTPEYEARARGVGQLLAGRDILNVCGELNTLSQHDCGSTRGLNQNAFGAAYYTSALIHLIRGGADLEMRWTATSAGDAYGLLAGDGAATPAGLAKQLFARHVQHGDWVCFPEPPGDFRDIDAVVAWKRNRRSVVFVHTAKGPRELVISDWDSEPHDSAAVLRLDEGTGTRIVQEPFEGNVRLDGYGIAVVTNTAGADLM